MSMVIQLFSEDPDQQLVQPQTQKSQKTNEYS